MPNAHRIRGFEAPWLEHDRNLFSTSLPNGQAPQQGGVRWYGESQPVFKSVQTAIGNQTPPAQTGLVGNLTRSYTEDYYNQLWLIPREVDVGALASDITRTIALWNAYLRSPVQITGIEAANAAGTYLTGVASGDRLVPLQYKTFTLNVLSDGPAGIDARYKFNADVGFDPVLRIIGNRAKIWPWNHNWSQSYRLTYSYSTEVITSRNGREQRIANRVKPRFNLELSLTLDGLLLQRYRQLMWSWQDRTFVLPDYTHFFNTTEVIEAGVEFMDIQGDMPFWVQPNASLLLVWQELREIRDIASVVGNRVNFRATTGTEWPVGTRVYLTVSGRIGQQVADRMQTSRVTTLSLELKADPSSQPMPNLGQPYRKIAGREVFDKRPNWANNIDVSHTMEQDEYDYGSGPVVYFSPWENGVMLRTQTYVGRNQTEVDEIVAFFSRNRGQQGEFYVPTWEDDLPTTAVSPAGSSTISYRGRDIVDAYRGSAVHRRLVFRMFNGDMLYREILDLSITTDNGVEFSTFTLDDTWPVDLNERSVMGVSWVYLCRFASDILTIEHLTDSVAQFQFTLRTLPDNPIEA